MKEDFQIIRNTYYASDDMNDFVIYNNMQRVYYIQIITGLVFLLYALVYLG